MTSSSDSTAYVLLEDGERFDGLACGADGHAVGEVVFTTGMTGYQEAVTDPSFAGQLITFTTAHVGYDYKAYGFPTVAACGWSGISEMPGTRLWVKGQPGMTTGVMAHEFGHNLGAHHANSYTCTANGARVALSTSCTSNEYGDPFSVMGTAPRGQTNARGTSSAGWPRPTRSTWLLAGSAPRTARRSTYSTGASSRCWHDRPAARRPAG